VVQIYIYSKPFVSSLHLLVNLIRFTSPHVTEC